MTKVAGVTLLVLAGCLAGCSSPSGPTELDRYKTLCHKKGGVVSVVSTGWSTVTYQCLGDSFEDLLPRVAL